MKTILIPALESLLQTALRYDEATQTQLEALGNICVALEISDWHQHIYFVFRNRTVYCYAKPQDTKEATLSIRAKLPDLIAATRSAQKRLKGIHIDGDVHTAQALFKILENLDIDWEEGLSQCIGDGAAYHVSGLLKGAGRLLKRVQRSLNTSTRFYLKDEAELIIDPKEADDWMTSVETVRDDVERLEARIQRLETHTSS